MGIEMIKDDHELISEIRSGFPGAFSELVKRHQKGVVRVVLRFLKDVDQAQDVAQETFIKAFDKLHTFQGRASFKSWLYQIAINLSKNKLRESQKQTTQIDHAHLSVDSVAERGLIHASVGEALQEEVNKLPHKQKTALVLRIYEDLSFKEIAQIMNCPYDTAKANYRHALLRLRHAFEDRNELKTWKEEFMFESIITHNRNGSMEAES